MKNIFLLFALLLCTCVRAQAQIVKDTDTTYAAITVSIEETDGHRRGVFDTIELGGIAYAHEYVQRSRNELRREYNRLSLRLRELNAERADRAFLELAASLDYPLDSLTTDRLVDAVLPDTFPLVVPAAIVPPELLADFTTATTPAPDKYTVWLTVVTTKKGQRRVKSVNSAGNWKVNVNSPNDFEIVNLFGPRTTTNFLLIRQNRRRTVFVDRRAAMDPGGDYAGVIIYHEQ